MPQSGIKDAKNVGCPLGTLGILLELPKGGSKVGLDNDHVVAHRTLLTIKVESFCILKLLVIFFFIQNGSEGKPT